MLLLQENEVPERMQLRLSPVKGQVELDWLFKPRKFRVFGNQKTTFYKQRIAMTKDSRISTLTIIFIMHSEEKLEKKYV